jgi:Ribosomal protein L30E
MSEVIGSLKVAVETGVCVFGVDQTIKGLQRGSVKLVVVSSNPPKGRNEALERMVAKSGAKVHRFPGSGWDLASVCSRNHIVSVVGIVDPGESDIFKRVTSGEQK